MHCALLQTVLVYRLALNVMPYLKPPVNVNLIYVTGARAVRSATWNVPLAAHEGGNQAEEDSVLASAGAPGEAGNVIACGYQPPHPC
jgi:hypothetical protein